LGFCLHDKFCLLILQVIVIQICIESQTRSKILISWLSNPRLSIEKCWCYEFYFLIAMLYRILVLIGKPCFLFLIQASSPLQVKYADGELERLGMIYFYYSNWNILISKQFFRVIHVLEFCCYIEGTFS
jgi:hypothetical protein